MQADPLAPDSDGFWQAIDQRLADLEQGLTWMDLAQTRLALHDLPGSLRMLGLPDLATLADILNDGIQVDPRDGARLTELAALKAAVSAAKAAGGHIPMVHAARHTRRLLVVAAESLSEGLKAATPASWRVSLARDGRTVRVWLRHGDLKVILWDPSLATDDPDYWLEQVPPGVQILRLGPVAGEPTANVLPPDASVADIWQAVAART